MRWRQVRTTISVPPTSLGNISLRKNRKWGSEVHSEIWGCGCADVLPVPGCPPFHLQVREGGSRGAQSDCFLSSASSAGSQPVIQTLIFFHSFRKICAQLCQKGPSKIHMADQGAARFETNQPFLFCCTPPKEFPKGQKRCAVFRSLALGKDSREHKGQTFNLCQYSQLH